MELTSVLANLSHQTARASSRSDMASWQGDVSRRRRLLFDLHVGGEDLADQADQLVDAVVVDAVFRGGKQAVLAAETQNVPGIDQGPALDGAAQQVLDFLQQGGRRQQLPRLDLKLAVVRRQYMSHFMRAEATGTTRTWRAAASV